MSNTSKPIKLDYPIQVNGVKIDEINMRRASLGDQIAAQHDGKTDIDSEIILLANLCGMKPTELHAIDLADYKKLTERLTSFLK